MTRALDGAGGAVLHRSTANNSRISASLALAGGRTRPGETVNQYGRQF
jgi:hypothetical protein